MLHNFFDTTKEVNQPAPMQPLSQRHSKEDAQFIEKSVKLMEEARVSIQEKYDDLDCVLKRADLAYTPAQAYTVLKNLEHQLNGHTRCMDTLKKIRDNKPITLDEHEFLLMMDVYRNTVVSRYTNIDAPKNIHAL
jgi:uncharacterized protein YutE (UPF0331/DUF86 family)